MVNAIEAGGIPWNTIFARIDNKEFRGPTSGNSGRTLTYKFEEDNEKITFSVEDQADRDLHLTVTAYRQEGLFTLSLKTKGLLDDSDMRHPDMYAGNFVGHALRLLKRRGIVPVAFRGEWASTREYSDNYRQFYSVYDATLDNRADAASRTWSGRTVALPHGFRNISNHNVHIDREKGKVTALFQR